MIWYLRSQVLLILVELVLMSPTVPQNQMSDGIFFNCKHAQCFLLVFTQRCLTFYDPMDCRAPVFPVLHCIPEFAQTHDHWVDDAMQPSHPPSETLFCCSQSFPLSGSFPMSWLYTSGSQSTGASASASVILEPKKIKSVTVSIFFPIYFPWGDGARYLQFLWKSKPNVHKLLFIIIVSVFL